jgi:hypothetical protein
MDPSSLVSATQICRRLPVRCYRLTSPFHSYVRVHANILHTNGYKNRAPRSSGASIVPAGAPPSAHVPGFVVGEGGEADDELLPAMTDDDYSAQLSRQNQSKENLKCVVFSLDLTKNQIPLRVLMEILSPLEYEHFEANRRHALPK